MEEGDAVELLRVGDVEEAGDEGEDGDDDDEEEECVTEPIDWEKRRTGFPLYRFEEVSPWLQFDRFILGGYRSYYTVRQCLLSVFRWHNETLNIWTHMLSFLGFLGLMVYTFQSPTLLGGEQEVESQHWYDYAVQGMFLVCAMYCFLSSTLYHIFIAHERYEVYHLFFSCDMVGISTMISGSAFPLIYYSLYCDFFWKTLYLSILTALFVVGFVLSFIRKISESPKLLLIRTFFFVVMACYQVVPAMHWFVITTPFQVRNFFLPMVGGWGLYTIAFIVYFSFLPERLAPGKFDRILSSHQLWHIFIVIPAVWWWWNTTQFFLWRTSPDHTCI